MKERLQKILSEYGLASRRRAEELIIASRVTVNGAIAILGSSADPESDLIAVDGIPLPDKPRYVYIMLNKPQGYITSVSDEKGRRTVLSLLNGLDERVYPIGRLDYNSEGLLLFTNDGDFALRLTHPKHHIPKTYLVRVSGDLISAAALLSEEMQIDGYRTSPAKVSITKASKDAGEFQITISEGRNRQVRKMCEQCGLSVLSLKRTEIGGVSLNGLPAGKWRNLTAKELMLLKLE